MGSTFEMSRKFFIDKAIDKEVDVLNKSFNRLTNLLNKTNNEEESNSAIDLPQLDFVEAELKKVSETAKRRANKKRSASRITDTSLTEIEKTFAASQTFFRNLEKDLGNLYSKGNLDIRNSNINEDLPIEMDTISEKVSSTRNEYFCESDEESCNESILKPDFSVEHITISDSDKESDTSTSKTTLSSTYFSSTNTSFKSAPSSYPKISKSDPNYDSDEQLYADLIATHDDDNSMSKEKLLNFISCSRMLPKLPKNGKSRNLPYSNAEASHVLTAKPATTNQDSRNIGYANNYRSTNQLNYDSDEQLYDDLIHIYHDDEEALLNLIKLSRSSPKLPKKNKSRYMPYSKEEASHVTTTKPATTQQASNNIDYASNYRSNNRRQRSGIPKPIPRYNYDSDEQLYADLIATHTNDSSMSKEQLLNLISVSRMLPKLPKKGKSRNLPCSNAEASHVLTAKPATRKQDSRNIGYGKKYRSINQLNYDSDEQLYDDLIHIYHDDEEALLNLIKLSRSSPKLPKKSKSRYIPYSKEEASHVTTTKPVNRKPYSAIPPKVISRSRDRCIPSNYRSANRAPHSATTKVIPQSQVISRSRDRYIPNNYGSTSRPPYSATQKFHDRVTSASTRPIASRRPQCVVRKSQDSITTMGNKPSGAIKKPSSRAPQFTPREEQQRKRALREKNFQLY